MALKKLLLFDFFFFAQVLCACVLSCRRVRVVVEGSLACISPPPLQNLPKFQTVYAFFSFVVFFFGFCSYTSSSPYWLLTLFRMVDHAS